MITSRYAIRRPVQFDIPVRNNNRRADEDSIVFSYL